MEGDVIETYGEHLAKMKSYATFFYLGGLVIVITIGLIEVIVKGTVTPDLPRKVAK